MTMVSFTSLGDPVDVIADQPPSRTFALPLGLALAVALSVAGFALIGFTWWEVSAFTNIAQQVPYLVSGGLTGLAMVVLSAALLVVVTRHGDDTVREERAQALVEALRALATTETTKESRR